MRKEKVFDVNILIAINLNHYSSNLIVCPSTLIDLLKRFYSFYPTSFHLPFIGSYPSLQGNKGITVTFQLHLPHGRKERKQQCKVRFDKIISTSININTDNVALKSFTPFWKAKKKHSAPDCLIIHRKIWICVHAFINHDLLNLKIESQGEGGTSRRKMLLSLVIWNLYFWSKNTLQTSNTPSNWTVDKLRVWDSHKLTCMIVISVTCNNLHRYPRNLTIKGVQLTTPYLAMLTLF